MNLGEAKKQQPCQNWLLGTCNTVDCPLPHHPNLKADLPREPGVIFEASQQNGQACQRCLDKFLPCDKLDRLPGKEDPCPGCRYFGGKTANCVLAKSMSLNGQMWRRMVNEERSGYQLPFQSQEETSKGAMQDVDLKQPWTGPTKEQWLKEPDMVPAAVRRHPRAYLTFPGKTKDQIKGAKHESEKRKRLHEDAQTGNDRKRRHNDASMPNTLQQAPNLYDGPTSSTTQPDPMLYDPVHIPTPPRHKELGYATSVEYHFEGDVARRVTVKYPRGKKIVCELSEPAQLPQRPRNNSQLTPMDSGRGNSQRGNRMGPLPKKTRAGEAGQSAPVSRQNDLEGWDLPDTDVNTSAPIHARATGSDVPASEKNGVSTAVEARDDEDSDDSMKPDGGMDEDSDDSMRGDGGLDEED